MWKRRNGSERKENQTIEKKMRDKEEGGVWQSRDPRNTGRIRITRRD